MDENLCFNLEFIRGLKQELNPNNKKAGKFLLKINKSINHKIPRSL